MIYYKKCRQLQLLINKINKQQKQGLQFKKMNVFKDVIF